MRVPRAISIIIIVHRLHYIIMYTVLYPQHVFSLENVQIRRQIVASEKTKDPYAEAGVHNRYSGWSISITYESDRINVYIYGCKHIVQSGRNYCWSTRWKQIYHSVKYRLEKFTSKYWERNIFITIIIFIIV